MSWQEDEAGKLNKEPLTIEVAQLVYDEFREDGYALETMAGMIVGATIHHMYERLLARGLLNEQGVQLIKLEQKMAEETPSDHEH